MVVLAGTYATLPAMQARLRSDEPPVRSSPAPAHMVDFKDPTYGGRIRQIVNPDGDEHNLYHYRTPFNADNSLLLGIETPKGSTSYHVTLYDGGGQFIKRLYTVPRYDWRVAWDRRDPRIFYTWDNSSLYRYHAVSDEVKLLRSFSPLGLKPCGPSLNQAGERILMVTSDAAARSYRLPDMGDERVCPIDVPPDHYVKWDKLRFTGWRDYFAVTLQEKTSPKGRAAPKIFTRIYDASTGKLFRAFAGIDIGHGDFSPDGKFAYFEGNPNLGIKVHVISLGGPGDRVVYEVPREKMRYVRNYHITWPDSVNDWFTLSFFPDLSYLPVTYAPPLDEILQVYVDGRYKTLARTGTACGPVFWAQPQQSPSADGTRILFHTNAMCRAGKLGYENSGTIDQCILYLDVP